MGMATTTVRGYVWNARGMDTTRSGERERKEKGIIRLTRERGIIPLKDLGIIPIVPMDNRTRIRRNPRDRGLG